LISMGFSTFFYLKQTELPVLVFFFENHSVSPLLTLCSQFICFSCCIDGCNILWS